MLDRAKCLPASKQSVACQSQSVVSLFWRSQIYSKKNMLLQPITASWKKQHSQIVHLKYMYDLIKIHIKNDPRRGCVKHFRDLKIFNSRSNKMQCRPRCWKAVPGRQNVYIGFVECLYFLYRLQARDYCGKFEGKDFYCNEGKTW